MILEREVKYTKPDEENGTPATTPGSVFDEEKFLVPYNVTNIRTKKKKWYLNGYPPIAMIAVSFLEIGFYFICTDQLHRLLRFEPNKINELWRFITYMLLHDDYLHLILNIVMQILFAYFLEYRHGMFRVLTLYLAGGITGVLGASCVHPDLVIGASGGVYALLTSHISDIILNFDNMKYKFYRCLCIGIIVISDITYNLVHIFSRDEPQISWGAHVVGGLSGLFLGLVLYRRQEPYTKIRISMLFWIGLVLYLILFSSLVILTMQIKKCTPSNIIRTRYIYFC